MHEIRVTVPVGRSGEVARVALAAGVRSVAVQKVYVHGPGREMEIVSAETSTPRAKAFLDSLFAEAWFDANEYSISARELRAILSQEPVSRLTEPMVEPGVDVLEDLWQLSHITPSYLGRAGSAAILLAFGMFENSAISIVVAALFLPFLSQVLAASFGLYMGDRRLALQGMAAFGVSALACLAAGAAFGALHPGPMLFTDFKGPLASFIMSCAIGAAAGLASADDAGRRYLIGVAAAVQYSVFPLWLGVCLVRGFPSATLAAGRLAAFGINIAVIGLMSAAVYAWAGMRREEVRRFRSKFKPE